MLKTFFIIITFFHGLIHFLGFSKAYGYGQISQLTQQISKSVGLLWLITAILFIFSLVFYYFKKDFWPYLAIIAVILSQILIFTNWQDARFGSFANIIFLLSAIVGIFQIRFKNIYKNEVQIGLKQSRNLQKTILNDSDIKHLPEPVKKYIRYASCMGKPKVNNFKAEFSGKIRDYNKPVWMKLDSEQYNFISSPARLFYLDAIMKFMPVAGFHCFKNGKAFMDIRLFSILKVECQEGDKMDISETVTFFNDMCVMAPATLIDKNIVWLEIENNKVKASFTNNGITISAWLYFNERGELVNFVSEDRYAITENGTSEKMKWSTPLRDYQFINGYRLASYAETIYSYPKGDFTYATFYLKNVRYNLLK
jgi:hypothetical protein